MPNLSSSRSIRGANISTEAMVTYTGQALKGRTQAPMSFMSGSVRHQRKEFSFGGAQISLGQEYKDVRSVRFERKGQTTRNRKANDDAFSGPSRLSSGHPQIYPVLLGAIESEAIRSYHNLEAYPHGFEQDSDVLNWLCALAEESPTARLMLKDAQKDGWSVRLDDLSQQGYAFEEESRCLILDHFGYQPQALGKSPYFRNAMFVNFVKALRQIWHEGQHRAFETTHRPDAALMLERARAADCETMAILAGWELRASGHGDIWRFILGSEEGDMAMIFTRAIEKDPGGFYDGSVLTRTFCQWYGEESRVATCDHATLERMDQLLAKANGLSVLGKKTMEERDVENLSILPGGRAYLQGMGANICTDPYFSRLDDEINAPHLAQIIYDSKVMMVEGVPFRDRRLARLIFPEGLVNAGE